MDNKVGDNTPKHAELVALLEDLKGIVGKLRTFGITLDEYSRKRLLHPRVGADPHLATVISLAKKYNLSIPSAPLQGIENDRRLAAELLPFSTELTAAQQLVDDTISEAQSESWEAFLAYYGALVGMSGGIPELAVELAPVVDFMSTGKRTKKAEAKLGSDPMLLAAMLRAAVWLTAVPIS
ncbi:MAG: hypothetical protein U0165_02875 [Polyangiaceae bacterium]